MRTWPVAMGSPISQSDIEAGSKVVLLGQTVVDKLFGSNADPTGQSGAYRKYPFSHRVLARKGQSAPVKTTTTPRSFRTPPFRAKIQGGLQKFIAGGAHGQRGVERGHPARRIN